ncbi:MAG: hypothetical protein AAF694_09795 [Bacteroidota bacterium]
MQRLFHVLQLSILLQIGLVKGLLAQTDPPSYGARAGALGHAFTGVSGEFWSLYHNPAGIAEVSSLSAGLFFEQRFLLSELNFGSGGLVIPIFNKQALGLQLHSFGFSAYQENRVSLSYGIAAFENFSIGVRANYNLFSIEDLGDANAFFVDVGLQARISPELTLGITATNVNRVRIKTQTLQEDLPTRVSAGLAYRPTEKVMFVADLQKDVNHEVSFRGGVEYAIAPSFYARVGAGNEPLTWSAGFGILFGPMSLDASLSHTEILGYTPTLSLTYEVNRKSTETNPINPL